MTKREMDTEQLIRSLTQEVPAVRPHAVARRIALGLIGGGAVTTVLVAILLGIRPDLQLAMQASSFWLKWIYTAALGLAAVIGVARLARPAGASFGWLWLAAAPVLLLVGVCAAELAATPMQHWPHMWLGHSWMVCSWTVLGLSLPIFIGLLWSFRWLAPTRLRAAGATAGLAAGAVAATIYCLHCPETSALFVLTWYTLGIVLATALGALTGPKLLRW